MVDRKPNLAAYARVSYVRELQGDLPGAASAMRLAVAAGGPAPENNAYVSTLLGELERRRGRTGAARRAFERARASVPRFAAAEAGLARLVADLAAPRASTERTTPRRAVPGATAGDTTPCRALPGAAAGRTTPSRAIPAAAAGRTTGRRARVAAHQRAACRRALGASISRLRGIVERLPLPEYVVALGETELAAGRTTAGRRDLALVAVEQRLQQAAGVDIDVELAVFEADHGSPRRAVALARRAWAAAPSVRAADALGWALARNGDPEAGLRWSQRALRLGSLDPVWRAHAGLSALAAGRRDEGRRQLRIALAHGLGGYPWQAQRAHRALR
jgi:tetratricopeptide (TPR) repeat protein